MRDRFSAGIRTAILMAGAVAACSEPTATRDLTSLVAVTPLAIVRAPLPDAHTGIAYQSELRAAGGQPPYSWTLASGALPGGMRLSHSGALVGAPIAAGTFEFGARATDVVGAVANASFLLRVLTLLPLRIATSTLPAARIGSPYSTTFAATGGAPPFNWVKLIGSLPPGLILNSVGLLSGVPSVAGSYSFIVEVQGGFSQNASRSMTLVVNGGPLTIVTRLANAVRGAPSSVTLKASGGTQPWTWSFPTTPPSWLTLSSDGVLTISATVSGTFIVNVRLRDAGTVTTTAGLTIVVARHVQIVSGPPSDGTVGATSSFAFAANEGPTPYAWSRSRGALPLGLALSSAGVLSGTPTTAGTFNFGVRVRAADGTTDTSGYTIVIASPPQIVFSTLPTARAGIVYNLTLIAQRGRTPYAWTLVSGPAALSVVTNAQGTRLTGTMAAGQYPLTLRVTDASGAVDQRNFTLTVN